MNCTLKPPNPAELIGLSAERTDFIEPKPVALCSDEFTEKFCSEPVQLPDLVKTINTEHIEYLTTPSNNEESSESITRPTRKRTQNKFYSLEQELPSPKKQKPAKPKSLPDKLCNNNDGSSISNPNLLDNVKETVFCRETLISGIRNKKFKRIAFLTGAGISVSAGIPDFRTPKIGLYSQLREFGLPHPEEIFSLEFLQHAPEPFYAVANRYLQYKAKPSAAHRFIKQVADQGTLMLDYTQNIDGLELDVGIPAHLLVQAHGHMRSAHCSDSKCRAEADMRLYTRHVRREEVLYCKTCSSGIVKPDIVFFGEKLPREFAQKFRAISRADLVFVMGTSLKVQPFSTLLGTLPPATPLVVLNHTNPTNQSTAPRENFLFLEGDIDANVRALTQDLGWSPPPTAKKCARQGKRP